MTLQSWEFEYVKALMYQEAAFVLEPEKMFTIETKLVALARDAGLGSVAELIRKLRAGETPGLKDRLVDQLTNHETLFFRDDYFFESLAEEVLPRLVAARRSRRKLDIWSAACSSGQEAYSVAMLICERFPELERWDTRIFATDVSQEMVDRTRSGSFSRLEVSRGLGTDRRDRFFDAVDAGFRASSRLRRLVDVQPLNLVSSWPNMPRFDLVLLRNVLIYFDRQTKQRVLGQMRQVLQPDGYLALGGGETTFQLDGAYTKVQLGRGVYYQNGQVAPRRLATGT